MSYLRNIFAENRFSPVKELTYRFLPLLLALSMLGFCQEKKQTPTTLTESAIEILHADPLEHPSQLMPEFVPVSMQDPNTEIGAKIQKILQSGSARTLNNNGETTIDIYGKTVTLLAPDNAPANNEFCYSSEPNEDGRTPKKIIVGYGHLSSQASIVADPTIATMVVNEINTIRKVLRIHGRMLGLEDMQLRYLTKPGSCELEILDFTVANAESPLSTARGEFLKFVTSIGGNPSNYHAFAFVNYPIFTTKAVCGVADYDKDGLLNPDENKNNNTFNVGIANCFQRTPLHEIGHTVGLVLSGINGATQGGHCYTGFVDSVGNYVPGELMCYDETYTYSVIPAVPESFTFHGFTVSPESSVKYTSVDYYQHFSNPLSAHLDGWQGDPSVDSWTWMQSDFVKIFGHRPTAKEFHEFILSKYNKVKYPDLYAAGWFPTDGDVLINYTSHSMFPDKITDQESPHTRLNFVKPQALESCLPNLVVNGKHITNAFLDTDSTQNSEYHYANFGNQGTYMFPNTDLGNGEFTLKFDCVGHTLPTGYATKFAGNLITGQIAPVYLITPGRAAALDVYLTKGLVAEDETFSIVASLAGGTLTSSTTIKLEFPAEDYGGYPGEVVIPGGRSSAAVGTSIWRTKGTVQPEAMFNDAGQLTYTRNMTVTDVIGAVAAQFTLPHILPVEVVDGDARTVALQTPRSITEGSSATAQLLVTPASTEPITVTVGFTADIDFKQALPLTQTVVILPGATIGSLPMEVSDLTSSDDPDEKLQIAIVEALGDNVRGNPNPQDITVIDALETRPEVSFFNGEMPMMTIAEGTETCLPLTLSHAALHTVLGTISYENVVPGSLNDRPLSVSPTFTIVPGETETCLTVTASDHTGLSNLPTTYEIVLSDVLNADFDPTQVLKVAISEPNPLYVLFLPLTRK